MKTKVKTLWLRVLALCFAVFLLSSCSDGSYGGKYFELDGTPKLSNPDYVRNFAPIALPQVDLSGVEAHVDGDLAGTIDTRYLSKGYVVAAVTSSTRAKFRVESGELTYDYEISTNGEPQVFPLVYGNGLYKFTIFLHIEGVSYEYFYVVEEPVTLENQFYPFLLPNIVVNYDDTSPAVTLAQQLAAHCVSDLEIVQMVYYWVQNNIVYDTDKAEDVKSQYTYLPNLEQILRDKKGICYDYAALVAAMLRANGIPCKLIKGNVTSNGQDLYHAWNMIWLDDIGWIAVKFPSSPGEWERIDLTFAAAGDASMVEFIGDGQNYTELYVH